jgi:opacity protein-like surface antigen
MGLPFGGRLVGTVIVEETNTRGKFPILSRLPPTHTKGTSDIFGVINEGSLNATLTLPMVTAFAQGEYTEVEYPGQDDIQLRKYWLAFGDLDKFPVYVAVGRKTVNFGQFESYARFTHTHSSHYFWAQSKDPLIELGYVTDRTELSFSLIPAHRGNRVLSSPQNNGVFSNYALNAAHTFDVGQGGALRIGAGYLRGTIYDSTIAHHPPGVGINRYWNEAWDINSTYSRGPFDIQAEFTQTLEDWAATGHKVSALTLQGRYRSELFGKPTTYSISASHGEQGTTGTEWERMGQVILGVELDATENVTFGAEYLYNVGFVPLIMPTITGDRSVESHTLITGIKVTF